MYWCTLSKQSGERVVSKDSGLTVDGAVVMVTSCPLGGALLKVEA